ncbi:MAG TPA: hypothetical protein RMG95_24180, partial [Polyangiaceae bacterium LLY-WYZ-15_(1-7)]|nr:hypothetical protein [Polyangiaceae bacterium LLY-WYZ-15_(1-7)]
EAFAGGAAEDDPLRVTLLVRDPIGVLGLELALAFDGPDLLLFPTALAALDAGPHGLAARVDAAARSFGLELDHALGALRWRRPVRRLLAEMLLPAGWRLPDERAAVFTLEARGRALRLRTDAAAGERGAARLQRARAAATPLDDELALLDLEAVPPGEEGEALAAIRRAWGPWLFAEAALSAAERAPSQHRERVVDALLAWPTESRLWERWVPRLALEGGREVLVLAEAAVAGPLASTTRARLVGEALAAWLDTGPILSEADEARLGPLLARAQALGPGMPVVEAASAALALREGRHRAAAEAWRRAADTSLDPREAGRWRRRAAELLLVLDGPRAAEPLFRQALVECGEEPTLIAQLAGVLGERGDETGAGELYGRLLRMRPEDEESWRAALLAAARHHVEAGAPDRARPFLAAVDDAPSLAELTGEWAPEEGGESVAPVEPGDDYDDCEDEDDDAPLVPREVLASEASVVLPGRRWREEASEDEPPDDALRIDADLLDGEVLDEASASAVLDALEDAVGASEEDDEEPPVGPGVLPPFPGASGPPVTLVHVADDELRALLQEAARAEDPAGLLEGALEEALADADAAGLRRVLRVLDRLDGVDGERELRERAQRLLRRLGEEP